MVERPPILDKNGDFSENVKGFIIDRKGGLIGLITTTEKTTFIQFLDKSSPIIIIDKETRRLELDAEVFLGGDPKKVLGKKIEVKFK